MCLLPFFFCFVMYEILLKDISLSIKKNCNLEGFFKILNFESQILDIES